MVNTNDLKGYIYKRDKTQSKVALYLGMTPKTFYDRMKKGVFGTDEVESIMDYLDMPMQDAVAIFFAK